MIENAPINTAVTISPGIPNANNGINVDPATPLFPALAAAIPSNSPFPKFSLFLKFCAPQNMIKKPQEQLQFPE